MAAELAKQEGRQIQTIIFSKERSPSDVNDGDGWNRSAVVAWANGHDFRSDKLDETETAFRLRQIQPSSCQPGTFISLTRNFPIGITAVSCVT